METKQIMSLALAIAIGALVFSAALIPAVSMATNTEDTFTNEGYFFMEKIDEGTPMSVVWDYTDPTNLTVNGTTVALPDSTQMSTIPFTIFCSQSWYMRYGYENNNYYVNIYQNASNTSYSGNVTEERSLTVSVTDAGVTTVNNGTDHTWSNATGDFFIVAEEGDYVMKKMDSPAYVLGDTEILGYGRTYARSYNYTSHLEGSVDDGIVGEYYPETTISTAGWTISDATLNYNEMSSYKDLYSLNSITYEITGENIVPYTATFSQFIVPAEVTAELAVHADGPTRTILGMIPVLMALALLVGIVAVGYMKFRN